MLLLHWRQHKSTRKAPKQSRSILTAVCQVQVSSTVLCPQPWDLALVLEFSDGTLRPEDFGARPGMDRFVMEVRTRFVSQKPDVTCTVTQSQSHKLC